MIGFKYEIQSQIRPINTVMHSSVWSLCQLRLCCPGSQTFSSPGLGFSQEAPVFSCSGQLADCHRSWLNMSRYVYMLNLGAQLPVMKSSRVTIKEDLLWSCLCPLAGGAIKVGRGKTTCAESSTSYWQNWNGTQNTLRSWHMLFVLHDSSRACQSAKD